MRRTLLTASRAPVVFGTLDPFNQTTQGSIGNSYREAPNGSQDVSTRSGTLTRVRARLASLPGAAVLVYTINPDTRLITAVSTGFTVSVLQMDVSPNIAISAGDVVGLYCSAANINIMYGFQTGGGYYYSGVSAAPVAGQTQGTWSGSIPSVNVLLEATVI